jgi:hypothetical protein
MATCSPIKRPHTLSQRVDPTTYEHALLLPDAEHWTESAMSEMRALKTKEVLEWGRPPPGVHALKTKFVFKLKFLPTGEIDKYKARLVAKGFLQRYGIDFLETHSPVFQIVSLRCVLAVSLHLGLDVYHVDVNTAFLNSPLKFSIWIEMPKGFANEDGMAHAKLNKSLYGLIRSRPGGTGISAKTISSSRTTSASSAARWSRAYTSSCPRRSPSSSLCTSTTT